MNLSSPRKLGLAMLLAAAALGCRRPLPPSAFRSEIRVPNPPAKLRLEEVATIDVTLRNAGNATWRRAEKPGTPYAVFLSYHWTRADGTVTVFDGLRTPLPSTIEPGQTVTLAAKVQAPSQTGPHTLELDLVQEEVAWFEDRGSSIPAFTVMIE